MSNSKISKIIAVDFDGTIVENYYPKIGPPVPGAIECLKRLEAAGHKVVLWTCRTNTLDDAVNYLHDNGVRLHGVCEDPTATFGTGRKMHADVFIDDRALGCPLENCCVDWDAVEYELIDMGYFN